MSITDNIRDEIPDYENIVEKLRLFSNGMEEHLRLLSEDLVKIEKEHKIDIKDYIINKGIPIASPHEFFSISDFYNAGCDLSKVSDYLSEELINNQMRLATISMAVILSISFSRTVTFPSYYHLFRKIPLSLIESKLWSLTDDNNGSVIEEFVSLLKNSDSKGVALRNMFEKLKHYKTTLAFLMQNVSFENDELNDFEDDELFLLNNLFDSIQEDDYKLFKETVNKIGIGDFYKVYVSCSKYFPFLYMIEDFIRIQKMDDKTVEEYFSEHELALDEELLESSKFQGLSIYYNLDFFRIIDHLSSEAKEAVESIWDDYDLSWLKDKWKIWLKDEYEILFKSDRNGNKKSKNRENTKKDHLNVSCGSKIIRRLAEGLVRGHDNPYLPKLVTSKISNEDAINKLVYLFTGEADNDIKHPYYLEWNSNFCLNGLKLLIYLLHYKGKFENNDPLNALDDNDETSSDGISAVVKLKSTGRRPVFPIVEKVFDTGSGSVRNASKPIGGNRDYLEQIVQFWFYCKNSDTASTE